MTVQLCQRGRAVAASPVLESRGHLGTASEGTSDAAVDGAGPEGLS